MKLGEFNVPKFDSADAAFGAKICQYPEMNSIPEEHRRNHSPECKIVQSFFFEGGKLSSHGLQLKKDVPSDEFYTAVRAYLCSFDPKHEHKIATCGWLIAEMTEPYVMKHDRRGRKE